MTMELFLIKKKLQNKSDDVYIREINGNEFCYEIVSDMDFTLSKNKSFLIEGDLLIKTDENGMIFSKENTNKNYTKDEVLSILKEVFNEFQSKLNDFDTKTTINSQNTENMYENVISTNESKLNILVSAICFINRNKPGAEIYGTFANRLLNDVMTKSPFDFRIITNEPHQFEENKKIWGDRVIVTEDNLIGEKLTVGPFNQLLKYKTMLGVDKKYDWLLYLDCDAGFTSELNIDAIEKQTKIWEDQGYDFMATRTNAILKYELEDHEKKEGDFIINNPGLKFNPWIHGGNLFSSKFIFYEVSSKNGPHEWMEAKLPSEHVWYIKNNEKLEKCGKNFKDFNEKFQSQSPENLITWDMESFEVGVSALLAGYNMGDLGNDGQFHILKIGFNFNNWEKVKY